MPALSEPLPIIALVQDALQENEYRVFVDRNAGIYEDIELLFLDDRYEEAFDEYKNLWYWCSRGIYVYPGMEDDFMKICNHLGIRVIKAPPS